MSAVVIVSDSTKTRKSKNGKSKGKASEPGEKLRCNCTKKVYYNLITTKKSTGAFLVPSDWIFRDPGSREMRFWYPRKVGHDEAWDLLRRSATPEKNSKHWKAHQCFVIGLRSGMKGINFFKLIKQFF